MTAVIALQIDYNRKISLTFISESIFAYDQKVSYKNSSGDEIANVNFCTTITYMLSLIHI